MLFDFEELFNKITKRYGKVKPDTLEKLLTPKLIAVKSIDKEIFKVKGQGHFRATFYIDLDDDYNELMQPGRTGKFVPKSYYEGGSWFEICKGRILEVDHEKGVAIGEIYVGSSSKASLDHALSDLTEQDFLEVDQYGASPKILSGLVECALGDLARNSGYNVRRMPEDCAKHIGAYYNYDFEFEKSGVTKKVEVKSLWGTDTRCARLIHGKGKDYPTSSCKFATQDIFAVSLFLRTGNINDFAFAASVSEDDELFGLPKVENFPQHVHQNPVCQVGNGKWFDNIDDVWKLV